MIEHAVVIAGGGPTGLILAGELALAGVDVAIVERFIRRWRSWSGMGAACWQWEHLPVWTGLAMT